MGQPKFKATRQVAVRAGLGESVEVAKGPYQLEPITSEEQLDEILKEAVEKNQGIVIDWMAQWCRKCIYLKPKLEKLAAEYDDNFRWFVVDVNSVPSSLVKRAQVTLWRSGKWRAEVVGGHKAWQVMDEIREMLANPINVKPADN
eukprot:jgi/Mesen1/5842/ME000298S05113